MDWAVTEDDSLTTYIAEGYDIQVERDRLGHEEVRLFWGRQELVKKIDKAPPSSVDEAKAPAENHKEVRVLRQMRRAAGIWW